MTRPILAGQECSGTLRVLYRAEYAAASGKLIYQVKTKASPKAGRYDVDYRLMAALRLIYIGVTQLNYSATQSRTFCLRQHGT